MRISGRTRVLGLLGRGIGHSLSPRLQNAALEKLGEDLVYLPFDLEGSELPELIRIFPKIGGVGLNVTTPHKQAIAGLVSPGDDSVRLTASVNTVAFLEAAPVGTSTDGSGFRAWMRAMGIVPGPGGIAILGFGATSRSLVHALGPEHPLVIVSRSPVEAQAIFQAWKGEGWRAPRLRAVSWNDPPPDGAPLVIGGLPPEASRSEPVARWLAQCPPGAIVVDLNYGPERTALRDQARDRGLRAIDGLGLLVHQAALSLSLWLGREVSPQLVSEGLPPGMD